MADSSGVYWWGSERASLGDGGPGPAFIKKYVPSSGQLIDFAKVQGVSFLHTNGAHVVWTDASSDAAIVWSNTIDASHPVALGGAQLVWQLAMDETSAYWVVGRAEDMDIVTAPLGGGPSRKIACHVSSLYALAVDETDVYYSTWLADGAPGQDDRQNPHRGQMNGGTRRRSSATCYHPRRQRRQGGSLNLFRGKPIERSRRLAGAACAPKGSFR